jgi:threonyl-tRNA synthetase
LRDHGFRIEADLRNEKIGLKIREHTLQRVPYMLIVGRREMLDATLAVRTRGGDDLGAMSVDQFATKLQTEIGYRCGGSIEERKNRSG